MTLFAKHQPNSLLKPGVKFCFTNEYLINFDDNLVGTRDLFIIHDIQLTDIFEVVETKIEIINSKRHVGANIIKRLSDGLMLDFKDTLNDYYSCFIIDACDDEYEIVGA